MGCGTSFVKYVLFFFNLFVALVGLAMVGLGVAVLLKWDVIKNLLDSMAFTVAPWVFIIIGAIVFIIAFFGCCGAIRESHCMIVTYAIFLLVIIIAEVVLAVLLFTHQENIKSALGTAIQKTFEESKAGDPAAAAVFNNIQAQLECCGNNGSGDYGVVLPQSCCSHGGVINNALNTCTPVDANNTGCSTRVSSLYDKWSKYIAGVAIGVACVEVVGALFALCLANSIRNMDRRSRY